MNAINDQRWPDHQHGFKGLREGLREWAFPLGGKLMIVLLATGIAVYIFHEELDLRRSLTLAVTPLTALLGIAIVPWIISIIRSPNAETTADNGSVPDLDNRIKIGLARIVILDVVLILVYVALPPSEFRILIGVLSASLLLYLLAIVITGHRTIPMLLTGPRSEPTEGISLPRQLVAWTIDLLLILLLILLMVVTLALVSEAWSLELSTVYWLRWSLGMAIYFFYYVLSLVICGRTIGHRITHIRIIRWGGDEIRSGRALLRAMLGGASTISFILASAMLDRADLDTSPLAFLYYGSAIGFGINFLLGCVSLAIIRELHPKGHGLLDIGTDTLSISDTQRD